MSVGLFRRPFCCWLGALAFDRAVLGLVVCSQGSFAVRRLLCFHRALLLLCCDRALFAVIGLFCGTAEALESSSSSDEKNLIISCSDLKPVPHRASHELDIT